jgi:tRNA threonylcarbamoyladenosine biosynthesis protein TsaE
MHFISQSEEQTKMWAAQLAQAYIGREKPLVITLEGEMGAGKTQIAKGVAQGMGVEGIIASPTYVLMREYEGKYGKVIHIDCWRTPNIKPEELGFERYMKAGNVVVIEWPEPLLPYLSELDIFLVKLKLVGDGDTREIITLA